MVYNEELHKNEMLGVEMKINEKMSLRGNKTKFQESAINLSENNFGEINDNIFENASDNDIEELKKKNKELENEVLILRKDLDLKEFNDKNMINKSELDKVQKEKSLLQSELNIEKEKNLRASEEISKLKESLQTSVINKESEKLKKYNVFLSYIKQVVNMWNPTEEKEKNILNKLKTMVETDEK